MVAMKQSDAEAQRKRFEEASKAVEADESIDSLGRAMSRLNLKAKPKPMPSQPPEADDK